MPEFVRNITGTILALGRFNMKPGAVLPKAGLGAAVDKMIETALSKGHLATVAAHSEVKAVAAEAKAVGAKVEVVVENVAAKVETEAEKVEQVVADDNSKPAEEVVVEVAEEVESAAATVARKGRGNKKS